MKSITRSFVCGVTCHAGGANCNGYCTDQKIKAPGTYEVAMLNFGDAMEFLKKGAKIAREGWNGKGMFVYYVPANAYPAQTGAAKSHFGEGALVPYNAYMALKGADNTVSTWAPSGSDALAEDWQIVL